MGDYLVEVKRSARRSNAAVGSAVCERGVQYTFDSREAAEAWAATLCEDDNTVWIRAANPDDRSDVDAYLIGWLHRVKAIRPEETPGTQKWLADYEKDEVEGDDRAETASTRLRGGERITDWLVSN